MSALDHLIESQANPGTKEPTQVVGHVLLEAVCGMGFFNAFKAISRGSWEYLWEVVPVLEFSTAPDWQASLCSGRHTSGITGVAKSQAAGVTHVVVFVSYKPKCHFENHFLNHSHWIKDSYEVKSWAGVATVYSCQCVSNSRWVAQSLKRAVVLKLKVLLSMIGDFRVNLVDKNTWCLGTCRWPAIHLARPSALRQPISTGAFFWADGYQAHLNFPAPAMAASRIW